MSNDRIGSCPFCKFEYVITDDISGVVVACPSPECGKEFTAGAAEAASSAPAETKKKTSSADTTKKKTSSADTTKKKTPPADTTKKTPLAETKRPPASTAGSKLRPMKEDDFQTVHPGDLIAHLSHAPILKTVAISLGLHVALIVLLSIGNFAMCAKYKTFSVTGAVAAHAEALKEEEASEKKAARAKAQAAQKAKREATQAKSDAGKEPKSTGSQAAGAAQGAPEMSAIERDLLETSSERPTESSMSLDDMDDGL